MSDSKNIGSFRCNVLSIELEPTHYKTDLWNAAYASGMFDVFAIYTQAKNWSPDGGHNYLRFPKPIYDNLVLSGRGVTGMLCSAFQVVKSIFARKPDVVLICGYSHIPTMFAILASYFLRRPFMLFVDEFNIKPPSGRLSAFKLFVRESLRSFCFNYAIAVLVCGRRGIDSALAAGCPQVKISDFPYVVDVERILTDIPEGIPPRCEADKARGTRILFFSGRMIERKGLPSLLYALSIVKTDINWVLWIEGAGPELDEYIALSQRYGLEDRCRFLGFCQYDLHSWLIRSADIILVPSLEDNWGIVVDEGLQLGKTVISSDATGSGYDRITDKVNGYLFQAGDSASLASLLECLIKDVNSSIEMEARFSPRNIRPEDNLRTLLNIFSNYRT